MSKKSKKEFKKEKFVFCNAPFGSVYVRPNNKRSRKYTTQTDIGFCCVQTSHYHLKNEETVDYFWSSKYAKNIRDQFLRGQWPTGCEQCRWKENNGISSDIDAHRNIPIEEYSLKHGNETGKPKYVDYRPDNLCNLMCTMCGPNNSNLIEKMYNEIPMEGDNILRRVSDNLDVNAPKELITKDLLGKHTIQLKVLGGEPTINKKVHSVLQYAVDKGYAENIFLKITTNFTNVNSTFDLFDKFEKCKIQASLDATGPTYDYIRRPARWSSVHSKLMEFAERYKGTWPKMRMNFNIVWQLASCFTVKDWLPELLYLHYEHPSLSKLHTEYEGLALIDCDGDGITTESVPDEMRHYILDDLQAVKDQWSHNELACRDIETLIKYTNRSKFTKQKHAHFKRKFTLMDEYKKTNMFELSPRFKELYDYKPE